VLRETVKDLRPDIVVVSGDFTQRARSSQFRAARTFLDLLPQPQLIVPGNHDVPLHNVLGAVFRSASQVSPSHDGRSSAVVRRRGDRPHRHRYDPIVHDWRRWHRRRELRRIRNLLKELAPSLVRILVAHHPFDEPHAGAAFGRARPGPEAVEQLAGEGIDVFLTGHLHVTFAGPTAKRYNIGGRSAIVVEAGTATSTRGAW
jgi:3',5'-cyclic AMP phosphodiesterase CpdA